MQENKLLILKPRVYFFLTGLLESYLISRHFQQSKENVCLCACVKAVILAELNII